MTRPLSRFLGGDALARLQDHAARLNRLQAVLDGMLPPQLQGQCRVANLKEGSLVVAARGGAAAVRVRQILPSLLERLQHGGHPVQSIKVKVGTPEQMAPERPATAAADLGIGQGRPARLRRHPARPTRRCARRSSA